MAKNKTKQKHMDKPVEEQDTAAWANIAALQPNSRVIIPSDVQMKNAKEYVDTNEK